MFGIEPIRQEPVEGVQEGCKSQVIKKVTEKAGKRKIFLNPDRANPYDTFILEGKKREHVEEGKNDQLKKGITVWNGDKKEGSGEERGE